VWYTGAIGSFVSMALGNFAGRVEPASYTTGWYHDKSGTDNGE